MTIKTFGRGLGVAGVVVAGCALAPPTASADPVADFYRGNRVVIVVGGTAGGGYGSYARTVQRNMDRFIPGNPTVIIQFQPGAGGLVASNFVANAAPKDGTVIAATQRSMAFLPLFGVKGPQYDPTRLNWIGSLDNEVSVCVTWHASGVRTIKDATAREVIVGATGPNDTEQFPAVLNNILNTRFKIITGYGGPDLAIAMERGEITGRCGWSWGSLKSQRGDWLRDKKVNILVQLATKKNPEIGDVPLVTELTTIKEEQEVLELIFARQTLGRPFFMAAEVPADRVAAIRKAFMATAADEKVIAELTRQKLDLAPVSGEEMQEIVSRIYRTPKPVVERAQAAIVYKGEKRKVKIDLLTYTAKLTDVKRDGRQIVFMHEGKPVMVNISGSRTAVTVDAKKGGRRDLKVGLTCTVTYSGPGAEAKKVECKN